MSSISCAHKLSSTLKNAKITILEAGSEIGGRIKAIKFGGQVLETGANWIHGVQHPKA